MEKLGSSFFSKASPRSLPRGTKFSSSKSGEQSQSRGKENSNKLIVGLWNKTQETNHYCRMPGWGLWGTD